MPDHALEENDPEDAEPAVEQPEVFYKNDEPIQELPRNDKQQ